MDKMEEILCIALSRQKQYIAELTNGSTKSLALLLYHNTACASTNLHY